MALERRRGVIAGLLFAAAIGVFLLLLYTSGRPEDNIATPSLVVILMPILWVAGVLVLAPLDRSEGVLPAAAVAAYAVAFLMPAATVQSDAGTSTEGVVWGFQAFAYGFLVVPIAWLANPVFVTALELRRRKRHLGALVASIAAVVLALTASLMLGTDLRVSVGYVAWVAGPVILAVALAARRRSSGAATENAPA